MGRQRDDQFQRLLKSKGTTYKQGVRKRTLATRSKRLLAPADQAASKKKKKNTESSSRRVENATIDKPTECGLLRLPVEVRLMIFRDLFLLQPGDANRRVTSDETIVELRARGSPSIFSLTCESGTDPFGKGVLGTCKQLHDEAASVLYGENEVVLRFTTYYYHSCPSNDIPHMPLKFVKQMSLILFSPSKPFFAAQDDKLRPLKTILRKMPFLTKLKVAIFRYSSYTAGFDDLSFGTRAILGAALTAVGRNVKVESIAQADLKPDIDLRCPGFFGPTSDFCKFCILDDVWILDSERLGNILLDLRPRPRRNRVKDVQAQTQL